MSSDFYGPELFSERLNPDIHDVYVYNQISEKVKIQIYHQAQRIIPRPFIDTVSMNMFHSILNELTFKYGVLNESSIIRTPYQKIFKDQELSDYESKVFFIMIKSAKDEFLVTLDIIELISRHIPKFYDEDVSKNLDAAFNAVFHKNGIGYELINSTLISKDNEVIHSEIVRPSLQFLSQLEYAGANIEITDAYESFKENRFNDSIICAGKAFESTMRIIIQKKGWSLYSSRSNLTLKNATASILIETIKREGKLEMYSSMSLEGLQKNLQALASIRNFHAHGNGNEVSVVEKSYCEFALNTAATNIMFLIKVFN